MTDYLISGNPLWPLSPNWREGYDVAYEFKTDIFTSRSGKEQRRAHRASPRKVLKFTVTRTGDQARTFSRFMTRYQGPVVAIADAARFARLTAPASAGATELQVDDATPGWLNGAENIVLFYGGSYVPARVQSSDAVNHTITLIEPLSRDWPLDTKIHPAVRGRFEDSVSVKNYADRTIEADLSFIVLPGEVRPDDAGSPTDVFNRREVFTIRPNFSQAVQGTFRRAIDTVDFGRGVTVSYLPTMFSTRTKQYQVLRPTRSERASVVELFLRMKGQLGEFYMPSYEDDFTLVESAAAGETQAVFAGADLHDAFEADNVRRAIMLTAADGSRFYRRITGSESDGETTTLTTDVGWPLELNQSVSVCWLLVHRFAVDQLTLDCVTDEVGQMALSVTTLEDLPVGDIDSVFSELDGAAQWVLDNWGFDFFSTRIADRLDAAINHSWDND